jgi:hypothetical protein
MDSKISLYDNPYTALRRHRRTMAFDDDLYAATLQVIEIKEKYLRDRGWHESFDNPAAMWLWVKTIESVTYMLPLDAAIAFQQALK